VSGGLAPAHGGSLKGFGLETRRTYPEPGNVRLRLATVGSSSDGYYVVGSNERRRISEKDLILWPAEEAHR